MFLSLARFFKSLFISLALTEVKRQSKKIRKSNEKVAAAYEAADRYAEQQASDRTRRSGLIEEADKLMKE